MSQRIASLHAEIGAKTDGLERGLNKARGEINETSRSMNRLVSVAGGDLRQSIGAFSQQLKQSTPQNLAYAATFKGIETDLHDGKISIEDAKTAIGNLEDAMGPAGKESFNFGKAFKTAGITIAAAGATIAGVVIAVKKAFEFAESVASLERVNDKFDRLSDSIGTTSDVLLEDLRKATKGTVSDMELVASATGFMELGLVKTREEAVRLTRVAGQLGMDMNQLTLTLTNQTTMRFDALGVSVDGFKERVDELKKSGMSAEDAFNEAFLRQAEDQIDKVGDISETTAGKLMMIGSSLKNVGDTYKQSLAPQIDDLATKLAEITGRLEEYTGVSFELDQALKDSVISQDEYNSVMLQGSRGAIDLEAATALLETAYADLPPAVNQSEQAIARLAAQGKAADSAFVNMAKTLDGYAIDALSEWGDEAEGAAEATGDLRDSTVGAGDAAKDAALGMLSMIQAMKDTTAAGVAKVAMDNLADAIANVDMSQADSQVTLGLLMREWKEAAVASGQYTDTEIEQGLAIFGVEQARDSGIVKAGDYLEAMEAVRVKVGEGMEADEALNEVLRTFADEDAPATIGAFDNIITKGLDPFSDAAGMATDDTLPALADQFGEAGGQAGIATGLIKDVGTALDKLDGKESHVYIITHNIGGDGPPLPGWNPKNPMPMPETKGKGWHYKGGELVRDAAGGPVVPGVQYLVGELGPELFTTATPGNITPNSQLGDSSALISEIRGLRRDLPRVMRDAVLMAA